MIVELAAEDYPQLLKIWESAVKNTHDFLSEADFLYYKSKILQYFSQVELKGFQDKNTLVGFIGTADQNIEMLFVHQNARGKGAGKKLIQYALENNDLDSVDVNEQNKQAVGFYEHLGFETVGKSKTDTEGKPYPILHMKLKKDKKKLSL